MKKLGLTIVLLLTGLGAVVMAADFNGDGTGEIAYFRSSSGLWAVREVTKIYFGSTGDLPIPGDYNGSGADRAAYFRASSNLWAVRDITRVYFGSGDEPKTGDYNGDGTEDFGYFRPSSGLWAVNGITRVYFGSSTDTAIAPGKVRGSGGGLLRTGQTVTYQAGDDGWYQKGRAFSYTDNGDGTVTDNVTGLMWARDFQGIGCNSGGALTWTQAVAWAEGLSFAGYSDWRLPNRRELESLVNAGGFNPVINPPFTTSIGNYWSSTSCSAGPTWAWIVHFYDGDVIGDDKTLENYVRAVRGIN